MFFLEAFFVRKCIFLKFIWRKFIFWKSIFKIVFSQKKLSKVYVFWNRTFQNCMFKNSIILKNYFPKLFAGLLYPRSFRKHVSLGLFLHEIFLNFIRQCCCMHILIFCISNCGRSFNTDDVSRNIIPSCEAILEGRGWEMFWSKWNGCLWKEIFWERNSSQIQKSSNWQYQKFENAFYCKTSLMQYSFCQFNQLTLFKFEILYKRGKSLTQWEKSAKTNTNW